MKLTYSFAVVFLIFSLSQAAFSQKSPRGIEVDWNTDKTKKTVSLDEFTALLQPDQIPPIYDPVYTDIEGALNTYLPHEPVISIALSGEARAYPLSILMFHEIVNDEIGGVPVSVTYCPLCNAAIVFDRTIGTNQVLDFGVSGMLRNSDLVMWDHQTESWWQQLTGEALVGHYVGTVLDVVPSLVISLEDFAVNYPDGRVLSPPSVDSPRYGTNPYVDYDHADNLEPFLFKGEIDERLLPMERVVDIEVEGVRKAYPYPLIAEKKVINDKVMDQPVVLFFEKKTLSVLGNAQIKNNHAIGSVSVFVPQINDTLLTFEPTGAHYRDRETGSIWSITGRAIEGEYKGQQLEIYPHGNHFAFAFLAFYPESIIFSRD